MDLNNFLRPNFRFQVVFQDFIALYEREQRLLLQSPNPGLKRRSHDSKSQQKEARTGRYIEKQASDFAKYIIMRQTLKYGPVHPRFRIQFAFIAAPHFAFTPGASMHHVTPRIPPA